jgi:hypothetical protein
MIKEKQEQFFTEFRLGGIVGTALSIIKNNHDFGIRP